MSGSNPGPDFSPPEPNGADFSSPARPEPEFLPCYRHGDRRTGITCQRCFRPICMQCMTEASVGFQCPDCAGRGAATAAGPTRRRVIGSSDPAASAVLTRLQAGQTPITWAICAIAVVLSLFDAISRGLALQWLGLMPALVEIGQVWRLLTYAVTGAPIIGLGLLSLAINVFVMVLIGRSLEPVLGPVRYLACYATGALVGGVMFTLFAPSMFGMYGFSAGVLGLIASNAALKLRMGASIKGDLLLIAILVSFSLVISLQSMYWLIQLGTVVGAGGAATLMSRSGQSVRSQTMAVAGIWLVALLAVAVKIVL